MLRLMQSSVVPYCWTPGNVHRTYPKKSLHPVAAVFFLGGFLGFSLIEVSLVDG